MQSIILAAGMGKRLKNLTQNNTKCMVKVNNISLIERMLNQLDKLNLTQIIIVIGYEGEKLKDFIYHLDIKTPIIYVYNEIYYKTNNIYSLFLAKQYLEEQDTLLLESDLIFEDSLLNKIIENKYPNLALVDKFESWMDGTVVTIDDNNNIKCFLSKKDFTFEDIPSYFKTVNIYKFSSEFSKKYYVPFLEAYSKALGNNEYYEQVLKVITLLDKPEIKALRLDNELWYEIDDIQDLDIAESMFCLKETKLNKIRKRFGGYWRYPHMKDFCYPINAFFPNKKLIAEMKANFEQLLCNYPSNIDINNLIAAKIFGLNQRYLCVGNDISELLKVLISLLNENLGTTCSVFKTYTNVMKFDYTINFKYFNYRAEDLIDFYNDKNISSLLIINPDRFSGNYIDKQNILKILNWSRIKNIKIIIDETFIDFSDIEQNPSLICNDVINEYKNLIIIKSISESFGIHGLRLGVIVSGDIELIEKFKNQISRWNINSFSEFYMQICEKYLSEYNESLQKLKVERKYLFEQLNLINKLKVIPSQTNCFICEVLMPYTSKQLSIELLDKYNILIKDLSKIYENGKYISLAIRNRQDNQFLVNALNELLI